MCTVHHCSRTETCSRRSETCTAKIKHSLQNKENYYVQVHIFKLFCWGLSVSLFVCLFFGGEGVVFDFPLILFVCSSVSKSSLTL